MSRHISTTPIGWRLPISVDNAVTDSVAVRYHDEHGALIRASWRYDDVEFHGYGNTEWEARENLRSTLEQFVKMGETVDAQSAAAKAAWRDRLDRMVRK